MFRHKKSFFLQKVCLNETFSWRNSSIKTLVHSTLTQMRRVTNTNLLFWVLTYQSHLCLDRHLSSFLVKNNYRADHFPQIYLNIHSSFRPPALHFGSILFFSSLFYVLFFSGYIFFQAQESYFKWITTPGYKRSQSIVNLIKGKCCLDNHNPLWVCT